MKSLFAEEHEQGEAKGLEKGIALGEARGIALGEAKSLLTVLAGLGFRVTKAQRSKIMGAGDSKLLSLWLKRALTARSLDEVFGERKTL